MSSNAAPAPAPASSLSTAPPSKSPPHHSHLGQLLRAYSSHAGASTRRLHALLARTPSYDHLLCTLTYLFRLLALSRLHLLRRYPRLPSALTDPPIALGRLASLIDDFRLFLRLPGLVGIAVWARSIVESPPTDAWLRTIAWTQIAANTGFQALENVAYLGSKGVLRGVGPDKVGRAYIWSARFWAGHVALEGVRLGREAYLQRLEEQEVALGPAVGEKVLDGSAVMVEGEHEKDALGLVEQSLASLKAEQRRVKNETWWRDAFINASWAPLTLHWSREEGLVHDESVAALGMIAGWLALREDWKGTA